MLAVELAGAAHWLNDLTSCPLRQCCWTLFPSHVLRLLVLTQTDNLRVTKVILPRPFKELELTDENSNRRVFFQGKPAHAAYFLGAMAHYIGDVSQYRHDYPDEVHHGDYEQWAAELTSKFNAGIFESAISLDSLVARTPFTATKRVAKVVFQGQGSILPAKKMDMLFSTKPPAFMTSVGASLNVGVNELADVLHHVLPECGAGG